MTITGKPVTTLPEAESVTNADYILVFSNGALMRAPGTLFRGDDATINGVNALTIEAGDNISLSQDGGTVTLSANISGVFIFKGPATLATLPPLTAANLGFTYNMTQSFTTTSDFIEGAGKEYSAGADVAVCDAGNGAYKYNVLSMDLSGLVPKTRKINGHALSSDVMLGKSDVGLGNVDNTADANKPVSTAQQAALDLKQDKLSVTGAANRGVYVSDAGFVSQMLHTLDKDVPANAVFTDTNTTYTLTQDASDGHKFTLTGSDGSSKTITIPDTNTTYTPETAAPLMDGTAAAGTSAAYARGDHVHPTDTSRASAADVTAQGNRIADLEAENALMRELLEGSDAAFYRTAPEGNPVAFSDGYAANVKSLSVTWLPSQSGSGDPSLDNVRPISGKTSVTVTRTGENGANETSVAVSFVDSGGDPITVYGGTLNVTTGELIATHAAITIDGVNVRTTYAAAYRDNWRFYIAMPSGENNLYKSAQTYALCDKMKASFYGTISGAESASEITGFPAGNSIYVTFPGSTGVDTTTAANAWFAENQPVIAYELATPATYQLTPAQLATLSGYNSVSADAGTLSVTYRADPSLSLGGVA